MLAGGCWQLQSTSQPGAEDFCSHFPGTLLTIIVTVLQIARIGTFLCLLLQFITYHRSPVY